MPRFNKHIDKIVSKEKDKDGKLRGGIDKLDELFAEACVTEKKFPSVRNKNKMTWWADYKVDPNTAYGYNKSKVYLGRPSGQEIDRYDLAWTLLSQHCTEDERRIVWAVNMTGALRDRGPNWRKVANKMHIDPRTVKKRYFDVLYHLWYKIQPKTQNVLHMSLKKATN